MRKVPYRQHFKISIYSNAAFEISNRVSYGQPDFLTFLMMVPAPYIPSNGQAIINDGFAIPHLRPEYWHATTRMMEHISIKWFRKTNVLTKRVKPKFVVDFKG